MFSPKYPVITLRTSHHSQVTLSQTDSNQLSNRMILQTDRSRRRDSISINSVPHYLHPRLQQPLPSACEHRCSAVDIKHKYKFLEVFTHPTASVPYSAIERVQPRDIGRYKYSLLLLLCLGEGVADLCCLYHERKWGLKIS